jgi:hypothetical protein
MKRFILSLAFAAITLLVVCQDKVSYQAQVSNYRENDTIKLEDLLKLKDIFTINKNCPVLSFVLVYNYGNYDFMMIGKSNSLTDDMKNRLTKFKSMKVKSLKITFKAITIKTPLNEEIKLKPLKYCLKIQ